MTPTVSIKTITPADAKNILEPYEAKIAKGEIRQRSLSNADVEKYANDIRHGHWPLSDQGISFDEDGNLINGRHRLWAIVRAGKPVQMAVFTLPSEYQNNGGSAMKTVDVIDRGRPRSPAQQLYMEGVKYATAKVAACRVIGMIATNNRMLKLSVTAIKEIHTVYPFLPKMFELLGATPSGGEMMRGYLTGPLVMYRGVSAAKFDDFIEGYTTGARLAQGSPILALKSYLNSHNNSGRDGMERAYHATCLALQHFDRGGKVNSLRYSELGVEWLRGEQSKNIKAVCTLLGVEAAD